MGALASRFIEFCRSVPGAEELDVLPLTPEQRALRLKCADFLFEHRSVIVEIKALETDTAGKFAEFLREQGFALTPGEYSVRGLFSTRANGRQLFDRASNAVATAVADGLAEANRQIRDTKRLLGITRADGVLIILNGAVEILGPQLVIKRIVERLAKSTDDGSPYHDHVTLILYFSEKHLLEMGPGEGKAVALVIPNNRVHALQDIDALSTRLVMGWAEFNGRPYVAQGWDLGL